MSDTVPGDRLERALAAFLAAAPTTGVEGDRLLQQHPDLADLLEPMLARDTQDEPRGDARDELRDELRDWAASERVLGDFRLVREIGRGGMGIVYEAWQRSLDRRVAVKVLAPALVANPAAVARFRREAAAASRVRHPHIVEVFGFGSEVGEHFFAMQFVDGSPLHDVAARFAEPAAAVRIAAQVADALASAHAAGLVHRDVKPGNVLVRPDGGVLLTDFGVARDESLPSLTRDGGFIGTLDYAAPEQVRGEPVDARADVWALGVILHELLAGAHPFTAPTQEATMHAVLQKEPPTLRDRPGVSDDLAAVVLRALEKNRLRRYASAAALLADLRAIERGEPVSVRLPNTVERLRRWARREPWRAFAAIVLVVLLPVLTGTLGYLWANAPRIEAAALAEQRLRREEILAAACSSEDDADDPRSRLEALRSLPDDDLEAAVMRALLHVRADDAAAARAALAPFEGSTVDLVRRFVDNQIVKVDPGEPPAEAFECWVRGMLLYRSATHRGARQRTLLRRSVETLTHANLLSPTPRLAYLIELANAGEAAEDSFALRNVELALRKHFPDSMEARVARVRVLPRLQPEAALALCDSFPPDPELEARIAVSRALALEHVGNRLEEALAASRRATELAPQNPTSWENLGIVLRKLRRFDEAIDVLLEVREMRPYNAGVCNALGLTYRDAGKRDDARRAFEEALRLRPDYAAPALNLGNMQLAEGDLGGAAETLQRAVALDPGNVRPLANLANALERQGELELALPCAIRATHVAPNDFIPWYNVASLAILLELPKLALSAATRAKEIGKKDPRGLAVYAKALLAQKDVAAADALVAARAADDAAKGADAEARVLLARALAASGDRAGALAMLRKAKAKFLDGSDQTKLDKALADLEQGR